ncbi:hypothetical protein [Clostridioides difficile]|nr:hypothetical protein [Clostridioides difficile]EQI78371.1 hypothetical protein QQI_2881 [Clostridioides difficile Y401]MCI4263560.1 hypothetical protein [Clostridioides difficile]MDU8771495.1 hypothetical protein [Clostridioides difficile]SJT11665.1 Uncharacterised protein [Clostridioides difficile]HBF5694988.1 hypothetical protein [Clostridioides difficile]
MYKSNENINKEERIKKTIKELQVLLELDVEFFESLLEKIEKKEEF